MNQHNIVRITAVILIALLATASIVNIHARSLEVHEIGGWHIWNISVGFALFFALAVYATMIAQSGRTKIALLPIVAFAGVATSTIQTGLYLNHGADWPTALAFGVGVPIAEGLLAVIDALMEGDRASAQADRSGRSRKTAQPNAFGLLAGAMAKRIEAGVTAQAERLEGSSYTPDYKSLNAPGDAQAGPVATANASPDPEQTKPDADGDPLGEANRTRARNKAEAIDLMLRAFADDPNASYSEIGRQIGRGKSTVSSYVDELGGRDAVLERVSLNGFH